MGVKIPGGSAQQKNPAGYDDNYNAHGLPSGVSGHVKVPSGGIINLGSGGKARGGGGGGGKSDDGGGDSGGDSGGGFGFTILGFEKIGKVLDTLTDPIFWQRMGIGLLGSFIMFAALVLIISASKPGKAAIKGIKTAGGAAAGAAVGGPAGAAAGGAAGSQL